MKQRVGGPRREDHLCGEARSVVDGGRMSRIRLTVGLVLSITATNSASLFGSSAEVFVFAALDGDRPSRPH
jgi:hypothetical protein